MNSKESFDRPGIVYATTDDEIPLISVSALFRTPIVLGSGKPGMMIQMLPTTEAFDKDTHQWTEQSVISISDPLGINGETLIGQRRTERPKAEAKPAPSAEFEESTFETLFPLFADPQNEWLLSALVEGITNTKILGWIYKQLDSIPKRERVDDLKKKILLNPDVPEEVLFANCIFCNVKEAQVMDSLGHPGTAISIHNDFPFAPLMHKVLILQQRKHDISQITADEITCFYELLHKCAIEASKDFSDRIDGFTYGMNYGLPRIHKGRQVIAAGASQPHLHSQVGALTRTSFNAGDRVGLMCMAYGQQYGRDYLADYLEALRTADLVIDEDDNAVLYVPIAQRFNYEVQIMVKDPKVGNILDTSPAVRRSLGRMEHLSYMMYQHREINIESFNTVLYATRFSFKNTVGQRMILSIYPRTTIMALSELAHRSVVDSLPWQVSAVLKRARLDILTKGPRQLTVLVVAAHPDDLELGTGGLISELKTRGHEVHALVVTDGCAGTKRFPEERELEANNAAKVLGINSVSYGRIRDGQARAGDLLYSLIETQIKRHRPDVIISHANVTSEHTDHKHVSESVLTVCARYKSFPMMFEVPAPAYRGGAGFTPRLYVGIDQSIEIKRSAIRQHKSEIKRNTINVEDMEQKARVRASEMGADVTYAEAFAYLGPPRDLVHLVQLMPFIRLAP